MANIALVDDDKNILESVTMLLEQEGYHIRSFSDPAAALTALATTPPDLAVLDIKMPRMDGLELLRRLATDDRVARLLPGHGPVIDSPTSVLDYYLSHRQARLDAVAAVLAEAPELTGEDAVAQVVRTVYADVPQHLWPAAALSVRAQVDYLSEG